MMIFSFCALSYNLEDKYSPTKAEWLEVKMNQYANGKNFTNKSNVDCKLGKEGKKIAYLYCTDGDYKATKEWKKSLKEAFQRNFDSMTKELGVFGQIKLMMSPI